MNKKNKLILIITILVVSISPLLAEMSFTAEFLINKNWFKGTLYADTIQFATNSTNDTLGAVAKPVSRIVDANGNLLYHRIGTYIYWYRLSENDDSKPSASLTGGNKLEVTSNEIFDVSIFDMSGKIVFSSISQNIISLERNTFPFPSGVYTMILTYGFGKIEVYNFMFDGTSFMISHREE